MAERAELGDLPGVWTLRWWMLMRPVSLHHRLKGLGIKPGEGWRLWRTGGLSRVDVGRIMGLLLVATPIVALGLGPLFAAAGFEVDVVRVALGLASGLAFCVAVSASLDVVLDVTFDVAFGVVLSVVLGVTHGVTHGVVGGVAFVAGFLRLPLYLIEVPWQLLAFASQRAASWITLAWSPVLHHELSYLPLPFLARHILDTAALDSALARCAFDACAVAPGQRRAGRRALAQLRAQELSDLARRRAFQSLRDLSGDWLPDAAAADGTFAALQEVGRYLRSAELTLLPDQQREQILAARERLRGLDNALLGGRDLEPHILRPAVAAWRRLVDDWLNEIQAAVALVLNPFRAGDPLDLEFGREVFRGREPLVAELEFILGDPNHTRPVVLDLLTRPTDGFPTDAIPTELAEAVWGRTLGQPYLTQLYGQLIVERLNQEGRRQAQVTDCAAVEPRLLGQAGPHYLSHVVQAAPEPARRVLNALARGETLDLDTLDRPIRRYLRRRSLITESGTLGIPVLGAYLLRED
ncbi:hypothetical protein [uncultured Thiodictyon sp.]|uniref:hypothetical protein n=1 Tax=uncultured Thiodictyon sp. TaxID=1846217 RepID=UPI0025D6A75B|nr:hypothetical protein [uncultured Thiodictyon sp.]